MASPPAAHREALDRAFNRPEPDAAGFGEAELGVVSVGAVLDHQPVMPMRWEGDDG